MIEKQAALNCTKYNQLKDILNLKKYTSFHLSGYNQRRLIERYNKLDWILL